MRRSSTIRLGSTILLAAVLMGYDATPSHAVVVSTTTGNTSAPADDFGFAHVGKRGSATAVYLGYGWMLTAAHVGAGAVELNGLVYDYVAGSSRTLLDPTGTTQYTDLTLFKVRDAVTHEATPRMTPLRMSASSPSSGVLLTLIGQGLDRDPTKYAWDIGGTYPNGTDWTWSASFVPTPENPGDVRGFKMLSTRQIRWGTNELYGYYDTPVMLGDKAIVSMVTQFDEYVYQMPYESQVVAGDSGGGVFYKRAGQWELTGIIHASSTLYPNQPGGTLMLSHVSSRYMRSYLSDLSVYRDQILDVITPIPGDASLDGVVDDVDASILASRWQMASGALWEDGDFNADGLVNERDAAIMAAHWFQGVAEEANSAPEPGIVILVAGAVVMLLLRRFGGR